MTFLEILLAVSTIGGIFGIPYGGLTRTSGNCFVKVSYLFYAH